ncbi:hypothetical protein PaecuDRAFT_1497 [Paenibacillus curdlanolyticus YK9]|uniref:Uncharacterized protein n=1 Tax=Paenibacillus curdlanolyticus YK9 TaxID=717606 RepID=E0I773_9BACL|nr:hypothetical protein [Paenibacillus curdlanolyticus]EFM11889.1 hypothetical protein PaecuDRAFT_1497 [Paenibacillus curdlanolyticus YK9]
MGKRQKSRAASAANRTAKERAEAIMTGAGRNQWVRKPHTQVVTNRKAEQRRTWCRKGTDDGAVLFWSVSC